MPKAENTKEILTYKGKPLVRRGNTIYYGSLDEKYIIVFTVKSTKMVEDLELSDNVTIELVMNNDKAKVIKKAERNGLYAALDIAEFWLEDAIENG